MTGSLRERWRRRHRRRRHSTDASEARRRIDGSTFISEGCRGGHGDGAAVPFTAFIQRTSAQGHKGGVRRGHTAGYGPLFPSIGSNDRLAPAAAAGGVQVSELWLDGAICSTTASPHLPRMTAWPRSPRAGGACVWCAITKSGRAWRSVLLRTTLRRRRYDDARVRHAQRRSRAHARQHQRYRAQLRRRPDAVGHVADLRGDDDTARGIAAWIHLRSARRRNR